MLVGEGDADLGRKNWREGVVPLSVGVFKYWSIVDSIYPAARNSATTTTPICSTVVSITSSCPLNRYGGR